MSNFVHFLSFCTHFHFFGFVLAPRSRKRKKLQFFCLFLMPKRRFFCENRPAKKKSRPAARSLPRPKCEQTRIFRIFFTERGTLRRSSADASARRDEAFGARPLYAWKMTLSAFYTFFCFENPPSPSPPPAQKYPQPPPKSMHRCHPGPRASPTLV